MLYKYEKKRIKELAKEKAELTSADFYDMDGEYKGYGKSRGKGIFSRYARRTYKERAAKEYFRYKRMMFETDELLKSLKNKRNNFSAQLK